MNTSQTMSIGKRLLSSMWAFWIILLAGSMGLATAIYLVWLKGNI